MFGVVGNHRWAFALALLAWLTGCTMIPKYQRPASPVPNQWPGTPTAATNATAVPAAEIGWRDFFQDPRLQQIIGLALTNNRNLRVAVLNVEAAQAQYRVARSVLLPDVAANANMLRQRFVANNPFFHGSAQTFNQYSVSLGMSAYELDLFGRVRSLKRQALEQYFATREAREAAQLALVGEVANQYLAGREAAELLALSRQTLTSVSNYYALIQASVRYGNATELDLRAAEAQVQTARANIAAYTRQRAQAADALELLLGQALPKNLPRPQPLESERLLPNLPAGLPSDLLQRRPDIRQAEDQLKAANANIGAARAAFFPTITLTGSGGYTSTALESLFAPGSRTWQFSPQITMPIFQTAYNRANLDLAHIQKRIQIANYELAIQTAFREVADALAGRATFVEQLGAQRKQVQAERQFYELSGARYREGLDSYLTVLVAQQNLYTAQQGLIQARYAQLSNLVALYQALGGGWKEFTDLGAAAK